MRGPEDPNLDDDEQPKWNIWIYDRETGLLNRIIDSDIAAEIGQDVAPRILPMAGFLLPPPGNGNRKPFYSTKVNRNFPRSMKISTKRRFRCM